MTICFGKTQHCIGRKDQKYQHFNSLPGGNRENIFYLANGMGRGYLGIPMITIAQTYSFKRFVKILFKMLIILVFAPYTIQNYSYTDYFILFKIIGSGLLNHFQFDHSCTGVGTVHCKPFYCPISPLSYSILISLSFR